MDSLTLQTSETLSPGDTKKIARVVRGISFVTAIVIGGYAAFPTPTSVYAQSNSRTVLPSASNQTSDIKSGQTARVDHSNQDVQKTPDSGSNAAAKPDSNNLDAGQLGASLMEIDPGTNPIYGTDGNEVRAPPLAVSYSR